MFMSTDKNTASLGFEQKIWEAADTLRGNLNAAEYEGVVLGLIFLKYISDKFEAKYQELLEDEYADEEDKDEYMAENVFFVPPTARWKVISESAHTPEIGQVIDDAMREIEDNNPRLKGILPKITPERNSTRHVGGRKGLLCRGFYRGHSGIGLHTHSGPLR